MPFSLFLSLLSSPPRWRVPFLRSRREDESVSITPSGCKVAHASATSRRPSKVLLQPRGWNTNGEGLTPLWTEFLGYGWFFFLFLSRGRGSNRMFDLFSWRFRGWMAPSFWRLIWILKKVHSFLDFWMGIIYYPISREFRWEKDRDIESSVDESEKLYYYILMAVENLYFGYRFKFFLWIWKFDDAMKKSMDINFISESIN